MTSEILILTPSAVALAADSAVTVGDRKTYNGVNKLFMLSNDPPMGIMTYALSNFSYMPLETIIKEFRAEVTNRNLTSVGEFKDNFENFLKKLLSDSNNSSSFEEQLNSFLQRIKDNSLDMEDYVFEDIIKNVSNSVSYEDLGTHSEEIINKLNDVEDAFKELIPDSIEGETGEFLENLKKYFVYNAFLEQSTGIVIAGFDKNRLFPSYIEFNITYLYDDKFILKIIKKTDMEGNNVDVLNIKGNQVHVKPLAQGDVINTFLGSIDESTQNMIINYFDQIHQDYIINLEKAIKSNPTLEDKQDEVLNEISKIYLGNQLLTENFKEFINNLKVIHSQPILNSIGALPKEELSNLAESLIKITSIKRKVQNDLETVGGPIDVAIITKGDGFIWTKRKHYFDGELNPQFFKRDKKDIKYMEK